MSGSCHSEVYGRKIGKRTRGKGSKKDSIDRTTKNDQLATKTTSVLTGLERGDFDGTTNTPEAHLSRYVFASFRNSLFRSPSTEQSFSPCKKNFIRQSVNDSFTNRFAPPRIPDLPFCVALNRSGFFFSLFSPTNEMALYSETLNTEKLLLSR